MEYRLLKSIEPQGVLMPKEKLPRLTAYPANNCVNPGLGQIARLYSFYVPMYSNPSLHSISKSEANVEPNVELFDQEGKGENSTDTSNNEQVESQINNANFRADSDLNPSDFNERKRKMLGSAVQESFLHPKIIKTDKIVFSNQRIVNKVNSNQTQVHKSVDTSKPIKHKFQFQ
jgi:hypothetical protein